MTKVNIKLNSVEELDSYGYCIMDKENSLSNNIKDILKERGLNQSDLSKLTGISRQNISDIIQNKLKPGVDFALKIAMVLNVSVEQVFELTDTAWHKIAKLDNETTLFIDLYNLKIIDNKERKNQISHGESEYFLLKEKRCVSETEYFNLLDKFIKEKMANASDKVTKKELTVIFNDEVCTKRYKKLAQKISPIINNKNVDR